MAAREPDRAQQPQTDDRLGSWKAIAAYLKRDITTVQRWERREGMPVHRHLHDKRGSVYAFRSELDRWLAERRSPPEPSPVRSRARPLLLAGVAGAVVVALGAVGWLTREAPGPGNPLEGARITLLTDFDGVETAAAVSRDGAFVAFLSDRSGAMDAWVTRVGTGEFHNLTRGAAPELLNPEVRSVAFSPDGALVTIWSRSAGEDQAVNVLAAPVMGGPLREYRPGAVEMDWSSDGRRVVFHTADPGDPTFVVEGDGTPRQVLVGPKGVHNHFPTWSPDDAHIYLVRGTPPDEMDLWRVTPEGENLERLTFHKSRVLYPTFLDRRTLLYLATTDDGSGPWLYTWDVDRRESRRISFGVEQYTSLSVSADGTRLVATIEHAKASLWSVPILDGIAQETDASRLDVPTVGAFSPRLAAGSMLYVSAKNDGHALWRLEHGVATELWHAPQTRVVGGPAVSPDGQRIAFTTENERGTRVEVIDAKGGAAVRTLAVSREVRGAPAWSPDGDAITVALDTGSEPRVHTLGIDGPSAEPLVDGYSINPLWSSDGRLLVYADADTGPEFPLKAVGGDGSQVDLPDIRLPRGSRRAVFVPGRRALIVLRGEMRHTNFWHVDLDTGEQRQLTDFGPEFTIRDFDVSADGREIVFDRRREDSDLALIELRHLRRAGR